MTSQGMLDMLLSELRTESGALPKRTSGSVRLRLVSCHREELGLALGDTETMQEAKCSLPTSGTPANSILRLHKYWDRLSQRHCADPTKFYNHLLFAMAKDVWGKEYIAGFCSFDLDRMGTIWVQQKWRNTVLAGNETACFSLSMLLQELAIRVHAKAGGHRPIYATAVSRAGAKHLARCGFAENKSPHSRFDDWVLELPRKAEYSWVEQMKKYAVYRRTQSFEKAANPLAPYLWRLRPTPGSKRNVLMGNFRQ